MNIEQGNIITHAFENNLLSNELVVSRFKYFAKEKFQDYLPGEVNFIEFFREVAKHYSLTLSPEVSEFFISVETAPFVFLSDFPPVIVAEEKFRLDSRKNAAFAANYAEIKKFFSKWITQKNEKEKQYFALSTINLIERNINQNNFLKYILYAVILAYDKRIFSPERAIQLLQKSEEIILSLDVDENFKNEFFYLINFYKGITSLKIGSNEEARDYFQAASQFKLSGISSIFYSALSEKRLDNMDRAVDHLARLIHFDKMRFKYAIENNSISTYAHFLRNAIIYQIFSENEFAGMFGEIENLLSIELPSESAEFVRINKILGDLNNIHVKEYYDDVIMKNLQFIEKFFESFHFSGNLLVPSTAVFITEKLLFVIDRLKNLIKNNFRSRIVDELKIWDKQIEDKIATIRHYSKEIEDGKDKKRKALEEAIEKMDKNNKAMIQAIEQKIEKVDDDKQYDPKSAFNSAMVYNIIISLMIFLIGGFAEGLMDKSGDSDASLMSTTILSGIKWGGITFLLGMIVAMFSAASAGWEKTSRKQRLLRDISLMKNHHEREKENFRETSIKKIKADEKIFLDKIKKYEQELEDLKMEKEERNKELNTKYNLESEELIKGIDQILK
ncbi:MAG: hypothetical protein V1720_11315 [bacterium]